VVARARFECAAIALKVQVRYYNTLIKLHIKQGIERMYVIDEHQQLQSGVLGFLQVWKQLPYYWRIAPIIENAPGLLPLMEFCYGIFARYRLPLTGKAQLKKE
jgi:predicted DCC family thiol-disulfide oxidoreductase YuxK